MQKPKKEYLSLYSKDCLSCHLLIDGMPVKPRRCSYEHGNKSCPASEVAIIITGRLRARATALLQARANQNAAEEARILQAVSKESEAAQKTFYQLLDRISSKNS